MNFFHRLWSVLCGLQFGCVIQVHLFIGGHRHAEGVYARILLDVRVECVAV